MVFEHLVVDSCRFGCQRVRVRPLRSSSLIEVEQAGVVAVIGLAEKFKQPGVNAGRRCRRACKLTVSSQCPGPPRFAGK